MKLNFDCIRDILLFLEPKSYMELTTVDELCASLKYSDIDIIYSCSKLHEANFIKSDCLQDNAILHLTCIFDITYAGHEFLGKIKSDNIWNNNIKPILSGIGLWSFDAISQVASSVLAVLITQQL